MFSSTPPINLPELSESEQAELKSASKARLLISRIKAPLLPVFEVKDPQGLLNRPSIRMHAQLRHAQLSKQGVVGLRAFSQFRKNPIENEEEKENIIETSVPERLPSPIMNKPGPQLFTEAEPKIVTSNPKHSGSIIMPKPSRIFSPIILK